MHRTLVDLADVLTESKLADAVHESEVKRLFDLAQLRAAQARVPGRKGRHGLDRVLDAYTERPCSGRRQRGSSRSCARTSTSPCRSSMSPPRAGSWTRLWATDAGLAIEVDGRATHGTVRAFYEDRARDRALAVEGIQVLPVTWPDLTTGREALARQLKALLSRR